MFVRVSEILTVSVFIPQVHDPNKGHEPFNKVVLCPTSAAGSLNPSDSMHIRHSHKPLLCLYSLYFISQTSQIVRYHFNCWLFLFFKLFAPTSRRRRSRLCFDLVVALQTPTLFETQIIQKSQLNENGVYTVYA